MLNYKKKRERKLYLKRNTWFLSNYFLIEIYSLWTAFRVKTSRDTEELEKEKGIKVEYVGKMCPDLSLEVSPRVSE